LAAVIFLFDVQFGTVADYFKLLNRKSKKSSRPSFPTLSGDFFPYSDKNMLYWTGYYSTRPFDKRFSLLYFGLTRSGDKIKVEVNLPFVSNVCKAMLITFCVSLYASRSLLS
jgi:hypothetical protein